MRLRVCLLGEGRATPGLVKSGKAFNPKINIIYDTIVDDYMYYFQQKTKALSLSDLY